ncbi:LysR substrate-binding domain-containing protein [Caulobacter sp. SSI4214]|uniref:LysR substrate-binding domain-containing protein n=1 Tax=Caulobacter sp. SSI4214 TaxID=2575739 RepID=UPI00143B4971|nr:LysR substrate-binding domain-containing protein [Caulobacter sp. SSI4214]
MELRHIRYFLAVAEAGSVSKAARERLHTSQPSLSRQLLELETELGVQLFARRARGMALTEAGKVFFDQSRRVLGALEQAVSLTRSARPILRIGCLPGLEATVLAPVNRLAAIVDSGVDVQLISASSPRLVEELRAGALDLAFMRQDEDAEDLHFTLVGEHEIVCALPLAHPLASDQAVAFDALTEHTYISVSRRAAPALRHAIDAWGQLRGMALRPSHTASNIASALSLVMTTGGFSLIPDFAAGLAPREVVFRRLADGPRPMPLALASRPGNASAVRPLVEAITDDWAGGYRAGSTTRA